MALHRSCSVPSIMFVDIQQSLEVLSVVVYRQAKVCILIQDYGTTDLGQYISPSGLLRELPPHSSSSNIAGNYYVSSNLDNTFWNASVFWSNLIGETFPTALTTH